MPNEDSCVFKDICDFFHPQLLATGVVAHCKQATDQAHKLLGPIVKQFKAVTNCAECVRHGKMCEIKMAKINFSGIPCIDFAAIGSHGREGGDTALAMLAWLGLRLLLQEPIIVVENVIQFPASLLAEYLGDAGQQRGLYYIDQHIDTSSNYGLPVSRERKWLVLTHRVKTLAVISPLSDFVKRFHRVVGFTWKSFFVSSDAVVKDALEKSAVRKKSRHAILAEAGKAPALDIHNAESWELALTEVEHANLQSYQDSFPGGIFSLYQTLVKGRGSYGYTDIMQTLIKNVGYYWGDMRPHASRWLLPMECLLTQGFPVMEEVLARPTTSFNFERAGGLGERRH
eukprot:7205875-Pyramimonas_sp.AAC.1